MRIIQKYSVIRLWIVNVSIRMSGAHNVHCSWVTCIDVTLQYNSHSGMVPCCGTFLVLMTTQRALQYSFAIHTYIHTMHLCAARTLRHTEWCRLWSDRQRVSKQPALTPEPLPCIIVLATVQQRLPLSIWISLASSFILFCLCSSLCVCLSTYAAVQQHASMFASSTSRSIMEVKERRPYCSLTKGRRDKEGPYTGENAQITQWFLFIYLFIHFFSPFTC